MPYSIPGYIKDAKINALILEYVWGDDPEEFDFRYDYPLDQWTDKLKNVCRRGVIALGIGIYEWIVGRYRSLSDDPTPCRIAESCWCANIKEEYGKCVEPYSVEHSGPVQGPLWWASTYLLHMVYSPGEGDEVLYRVPDTWDGWPDLEFLMRLALHILPDAKVFERWLDVVVDRLVRLHSVPEDLLGDLFDFDKGDDKGKQSEEKHKALFVAREVLDPAFAYRPEQAPVLLDRFLRQADYTQNPLLSSPEELMKYGVKHPYRLDLFESDTDGVQEQTIEQLSQELLQLNAITYPMNYKWNESIQRACTKTDTPRYRFEKALHQVGYKASIGLAAALLELILCRFSKSSDLTDAMIQDTQYKLEALWMAAMDPLYVQKLNYNHYNESPEGIVHGPLCTLLRSLEGLSETFNARSRFIHSEITSMILIAEHITPKKKVFRKWFSQILKKTVATFPYNWEYIQLAVTQSGPNAEREYLYWNEPPVFRDFFFGLDPGHNEGTARQKILALMKSAGDTGNPYLRSYEEMVRLGFDGKVGGDIYGE